jgi:hypothetical protein
MIARDRKLVWVVALITTLVMTFSLAGAAFAGATVTTGPVVVTGYVIDQDENPVDGTQVPLTVSAVSTVAGSIPSTVEQNGSFSFTGLAEGQWNFELQLPQEWDGIAPVTSEGGLAQTGLTELTLANMPPGPGFYRIVFKIRRLFNLTVIKWLVQNDGSVVPGAGWTFQVSPASDWPAPGMQSVTGGNGQVTFQITPGTWDVDEVPPFPVSTFQRVWPNPGTVPPAGGPVQLVLNDYSTDPQPIAFKNEVTCTGNIEIQKIGYGTDPNGNKVLLGGLAGFNVEIDDGFGHPVPGGSGMTDATGTFTSPDLAPGQYTVREVAPFPSGWQETSTDPQAVTLGCTTTVVTITNQELENLYQISGNKSLLFTSGPFVSNTPTTVGLANWQINATLVGSTTMITTSTDALGNYVFTQDQLKAAGMAFPGAAIDVAEVIPTTSPWYPVGKGDIVVQFPSPMPAGYAGIANVNFVNRQTAPPVVVNPTTPTVQPCHWCNPLPPPCSCRARTRVYWGDTLGGIAAEYGTPIFALMRANRISNPELIFSGQRLCIPFN